MPTTLLDFVSGALRGSIECSLADLAALAEFAAMGPLEVLPHVASLCESHSIECAPPLTSGELDDKRVFSRKRAPDEFASALVASRQSGENHKVEFKQTLGLNVGRLENDPGARVADLFQEEIVHAVIKSVVGFLNADGGVLVIGLRDDGDPYGIDREFPYVGGSCNQDQWELKLNAAFDAFIPDFRIILGYVRYAIVECEGCMLCVVMVEPRRDRISVCRLRRDATDEIFYRRSGNRTLRLQPREIEAHVLARVSAAEVRV